MSIELQAKVNHLEHQVIGLAAQVEELERLVAEIQDQIGGRDSEDDSGITEATLRALAERVNGVEDTLSHRAVTVSSVLERLAAVEAEQMRRRGGRPRKNAEG